MNKPAPILKKTESRIETPFNHWLGILQLHLQVLCNYRAKNQKNYLPTHWTVGHVCAHV